MYYVLFAKISSTYPNISIINAEINILIPIFIIQFKFNIPIIAETYVIKRCTSLVPLETYYTAQRVHKIFNILLYKCQFLVRN